MPQQQLEIFMGCRPPERGASAPDLFGGPGGHASVLC